MTVAGATAGPVSARTVAEAAERLAAPSAVVSGVLALLDEGDAPMRLIAARVAQSPEIAAHVLRLASSALFAAPVATLEAAIVRVGERALRGLLLAATTYRLLEGPLPVYGLPRLALVRHSGEVAATAQALARRRWPALAGPAYLAGLLHDLGKPIIASVAGPGAAPGAVADLAGERAVVGTDHARVGAWIARRWGLSAEIAAAMERHHAGAPPEEPLASLVWLADIAVHAGAGDADAIERLPEAAAACGLAPDALEALLTATPDADAPGRPPGLTEREAQVLRLLGTGAAPKQVAQRLGCSPSTVHNHLHHVYRKLGVSGQSQALLLARERGWI